MHDASPWCALTLDIPAPGTSATRPGDAPVTQVATPAPSAQQAGEAASAGHVASAADTGGTPAHRYITPVERDAFQAVVDDLEAFVQRGLERLKQQFSH